MVRSHPSPLKMRLVKKEKATTLQVTDSCKAIEYPNGDKDLWAAVIEIKGRYPSEGVTINEACKEFVFVSHGKGKVTVGNKTHEIRKGDMILIEPGELFYWEGEMILFMPCAPAWYPEQHKTLKK